MRVPLGQRISAGVLSLTLVVVGVGSPASAAEYVPTGPSLKDTGKVAFLLQDDRGSLGKLINRVKKPGESSALLGNQWCRSFTTESCSLEEGETLNVNASLGLCKADEIACVESVKIFRSGDAASPAKFIRETSGNELPESPLNTPVGGGVTIWQVEGLTSEEGSDLYAVGVALGFQIIDGKSVKYTAVSTAVAPVNEITDSRYSPTEIGSWMRDGVEWWWSDNGSIPGYDCFATDYGKCWMRTNFGPDTRVEIELRLPNTLSGWLHGRLNNSSLKIEPFSTDSMKVSVAADPVTIPVMYAVVDEKQSNPELQAALQSGGFGTGGFNGGNGGLEWKLYSSESWEAMRLVSGFAKQVSNRAVATQSVWRFKSIWSDTGNKCLDARGELIGLVTTNAIAYEAGPPRFDRGTLNYKTAGLHLHANGEVVQGSYNLIIRSETARCLYGFSKAPLAASISVSGDGDRSIATTVVGEKNGWLSLRAEGFTFSEKTIKVKVTQKKTTITCVAKGKKSKKITAVNPKCPKGYKKR